MTIGAMHRRDLCHVLVRPVELTVFYALRSVEPEELEGCDAED